jgi:spermidine synthase
MPPLSSRRQFALFLLSGFSGLVYQIIWLRLAFAAFGVITPVISVVLSVFMLGLGAGSWLAGRLVGGGTWSQRAALRAYAGAEFVIGLGGLFVPALFRWGEEALLPVGATDSAHYLGLSALAIVLALAPFCVGMGMTFPLMMQAVRAGGGAADSFSRLYLANVLGALLGTLLTPLVLVELWGFRGALLCGTAANWLAAVLSVRTSFAPATAARVTDAQATPAAAAVAQDHWTPRGFALATLFATGLASMGMEVVWTRAFTPILQTQVYSFAGLLFAYLLATWCGSALYRRHRARGRELSFATLISAVALAAFGQLLAADPRLAPPVWQLDIARVLLGIMPYCGLLGYLTPQLIDHYSQGRPGEAGSAYAINVLGCILGPLLASYGLLPQAGVHWSGVLLGLPVWGLATAAQRGRRISPLWITSTLCGLLAAMWGVSYEEQYAADGDLVLRDHTATVIAINKPERKELLVNGKSITALTPTTKLMAHLPLAQLQHEPKSALVICFGMGTTYRALLSWNIHVTAVELAPSVRDAFGYFYQDAAEVVHNPLGQIVIDDGRRYLRRTTERFDVITLDPPPPVEAAGSSLLYSRTFYQLVKPRLAEGGILQQWYPGGDLRSFQALVRSVTDEFPHVRLMRGFDGWGYHILASEQPIPMLSPEALAARIPDAAQRDLLERTPHITAADLLRATTSQEYNPADVVDPDPRVEITDDRPYNEYYALRRIWEWWTGTYVIVL